MARNQVIVANSTKTIATYVDTGCYLQYLLKDENYINDASKYLTIILLVGLILIIYCNTTLTKVSLAKILQRIVMDNHWRGNSNSINKRA